MGRTLSRAGCRDLAAACHGLAGGESHAPAAYPRMRSPTPAISGPTLHAPRPANRSISWAAIPGRTAHTMSPEAEVARIAAPQHGMVTWAQMRDAGVSRDAITAHVRKRVAGGAAPRRLPARRLPRPVRRRDGGAARVRAARGAEPLDGGVRVRALRRAPSGPSMCRSPRASPAGGRHPPAPGLPPELRCCREARSEGHDAGPHAARPRRLDAARGAGTAHRGGAGPEAREPRRAPRGDRARSAEAGCARSSARCSTSSMSRC